MMDILKRPYSLCQDQLDFYSKNKFIKLKNVLDDKSIAHFNNVISKKVSELNLNTISLKQKDTYGKAFIQMMNLWTQDNEIKKLVFSERLGQIASDLMHVDGVRLYHDQALFKEAGGGITPWHADQYYWPLSNDNTITAWIPLQATSLQMGTLEFSARSHQMRAGRDLEIGDESEKILSKKLRVTDFEHVIEPFDIGEVSFHSGWIFHRAGANQTELIRKAFTIIFMDKEMTLKEPENKNQLNDWNTWCPGVKVGEVIGSRLNPITYQIN